MSSTAESKTASAVALDQWTRAYRNMVRIRIFEEHVNDLYTRALMPGLAHLYVGEEGVAVGVCEALRPDDYITSTHCFFGEGALGQGVLYEVMNLAQLWKLPVIYVCENNLYNEYTHYLETTAGDILARATAFGIFHVASVDGQDMRAVYATAKDFVNYSRAGEGPCFLLCNTYRYAGHHVGDINREYYRSKQEEQQWKSERDPINILRAWLREQGFADSAFFAQTETEVRAEMENAVQFALSAPYPDPAEVEQDVYA